MPSNVNRSKRYENITKLGLIFLFLGGLAVFIGYMTFWGPGLTAFQLSWLDLVLLVLATYRLGHLVAYDRVMEPVRRYFTETVPDPTGAGDTVEPKGVGIQQVLGQLICCPICSGTWISAVLVYVLYLWPDPTHVFLIMTAAIGGAEFLNAASEALSWTGQHQRMLTGAQMQARKKNVVRIEQPCEDSLPERDEVRSLSERIQQIRQKE